MGPGFRPRPGAALELPGPLARLRGAPLATAGPATHDGDGLELLEALAYERDFVRPNDLQAKRHRTAAAEALSRLRSSAAA